MRDSSSRPYIYLCVKHKAKGSLVLLCFPFWDNARACNVSKCHWPYPQPGWNFQTNVHLTDFIPPCAYGYAYDKRVHYTNKRGYQHNCYLGQNFLITNLFVYMDMYNGNIAMWCYPDTYYILLKFPQLYKSYFNV